MQTQYVPEFINECILKLEDGINEKERIFDLLGIKPIAKDISDTNGQYIHLGVHFNRKKYKNRNVWLEKKELEKGLKKHQFYTFKSKLKDLDGDIDNLVTNQKTVKKEKWSTYLKKFFKKNKLTIRKKTNSDGLIMYDYNSIEPNIDYKALYRNEVNQLPEYDWSDVNIDNYNNTYLSDGMFERYMKKFNPEVYFLHQHEKIVQTLKKKL